MKAAVRKFNSKWRFWHGQEVQDVDFSKLESELQAAHLVQPAFTVSEVIPASESICPSGSSTAFMNSALGAG